MNVEHKGDSGYSHHIIDDSSNFDNHSKVSQSSHPTQPNRHVGPRSNEK
jgi:hypothetical protein